MKGEEINENPKVNENTKSDNDDDSLWRQQK